MAAKAAKGGVWFKASPETQKFLKTEADRRNRSLSGMISVWMDMAARGTVDVPWMEDRSPEQVKRPKAKTNV